MREVIWLFTQSCGWQCAYQSWPSLKWMGSKLKSGTCITKIEKTQLSEIILQPYVLSCCSLLGLPFPAAPLPIPQGSWDFERMGRALLISSALLEPLNLGQDPLPLWAPGSRLSPEDLTPLNGAGCGSDCTRTLAALAVDSSRPQSLPSLVTPWLWTGSY